MPRTSSSPSSAHVLILGTGGTIAGTAESPTAPGYRAAQLGVEALVAAVPALAAVTLQAEQLAQVDSKDMDFAIWRRLMTRLEHALGAPDCAGIVITHGTDTLEETAYFLQRVLAPNKPVVLAAAMRPATALQADGPQNLLDAVTLAREPGARGVLAVLAGTVHGGLDVRKIHTHRPDAFGSGDAGPIGRIEAGVLRRWRDWPGGPALGSARLATAHWPRVELVTSHAGATGTLVEALQAQGVEGLVVAGTGNGSVHHTLQTALERAQAAGVAVRRASRVPDGPVTPVGQAGEWPSYGALTPVQARIELMLELMGPN